MATPAENKILADMRAEIGTLRQLVVDHDAALKSHLERIGGQVAVIDTRLTKLDNLVLGETDTRLREATPGMYAVLMEVAGTIERQRTIGSFVRATLLIVGGGAITTIFMLARAVILGDPSP